MRQPVQAAPRLVEAGQLSWKLQWDRAAEGQIIEQLALADEGAPRLVVIRNIDAENQQRITNIVKENCRPDKTTYHNVNITADFWQVVVQEFYNSRQSLPFHL